jgi:hypothetical protein
MTPRTRRQFVQEVTIGSAAALLASRRQPLAPTASASQWRSRIGLELYTVRDLLATDYEGTLTKVAEIGYTAVEPTSYDNMSPKSDNGLSLIVQQAIPRQPGRKTMPSGSSPAGIVRTTMPRLMSMTEIVSSVMLAA